MTRLLIVYFALALAMSAAAQAIAARVPVPGTIVPSTPTAVDCSHTCIFWTNVAALHIRAKQPVTVWVTHAGLQRP